MLECAEGAVGGTARTMALVVQERWRCGSAVGGVDIESVGVAALVGGGWCVCTMGVVGGGNNREVRAPGCLYPTAQRWVWRMVERHDRPPRLSWSSSDRRGYFG